MPFSDVIFIVPVNYVDDSEKIYCHSEGMKIDLMQENPEIRFEVGDIKDLTNW